MGCSTIRQFGEVSGRALRGGSLGGAVAAVLATTPPPGPLPQGEGENEVRNPLLQGEGEKEVNDEGARDRYVQYHR